MRRQTLKTLSYKWPVVALLAMTLGLSDASSAATCWVAGNVTRVLTMNDKFGTCMALLSSRNTNLSCSAWVTFDCEGSLEGNTRAVGNAKFNAAQLALVTGNRVRVQIDDGQKINGQCFAPRMDVYNN